MRVFVIADASKRKAKPIGVLTWEPCEESEQGRFSLELVSGLDERELPLSLSFCARREAGRATPEESEAWVRSRIVPEDRHNIVEVLRANGLVRYDEVSLLAACQGRSSDDDFLAFEVPIPAEWAGGLPTRGSSAGAAAATGESFADLVVKSVRRRRAGGEVRYAFVDMPKEHASDTPLESENRMEGSRGETGWQDESGQRSEAGLHSETNQRGEPASAAQRIGAQIRAARLEAGLTQMQLAARAGISQVVLSRLEAGKGNPTLSLLEEVAGALNAKLDVSVTSNPTMR